VATAASPGKMARRDYAAAAGSAIVAFSKTSSPVSVWGDDDRRSSSARTSLLCLECYSRSAASCGKSVISWRAMEKKRKRRSPDSEELDRRKLGVRSRTELANTLRSGVVRPDEIGTPVA
jgi:hypothetical protein